MAYRPYPNPERALRQLDRHEHPAPEPTELRKQMAAQANTALAVMAEAAKQLRGKLEAMGAPRRTPLALQMAFVLDRQLKVELAQSAPGVLVMHEMVQQMRRPSV
jgi:hypothetical protein